MTKTHGFIFLIIMFLLSSCSSTPKQIVFPSPGQSFESSNKKSLVFGRLDILLEGYSLPLNPSSLHVYYLSDVIKDKLDSVQTYFIDISQDDGYFVAALPPGKYAIDEITHRINIPSLKNFSNVYRKVYDGGRYDDILYDIFIFEVFPEKATYLGTMQAINNRYLYIDKWEIKSEYEEAKKVFLTLYPNHIDPVEKLAELRPCRYEENNKIMLRRLLCLPLEKN